MNLSWLSYVLRALQLAPVIVAGIEHIHGEAPGATKKQMAMDALGLAYGTASGLLPQDQPAIDAATSLTSNVIDGVVNVFNATGAFSTGAAPAKPALSVNAFAPQGLSSGPPAPAPAPAAEAPTPMPTTIRD